MDGEVKGGKYVTNQTAIVHSYAKLSKAESPRTHTSPTSILRKFPQSLRHDQKHQTKIKRNSSPVACGATKAGKKVDRDVKSWCLGDGRKAMSSAVDRLGEYTEEEEAVGEARLETDSEFDSVQEMEKENGDATTTTAVEESGFACQGERLKIGSLNKLSVINNSLNEFTQNVSERLLLYRSADGLNGKMLSPVHKSTPNLVRGEGFASRASNEDEDDEDGGVGGSADRCHREKVPLRWRSESSPQLSHKYRIIHSILPKINRTICESHESLSKGSLTRGCIKSDSHINANILSAVGRSDSYQLLGDSRHSDLGDLCSVRRKPILEINGKSDAIRSEDENERISLIRNKSNVVIRATGERQGEAKNRWPGKRTVEIMPSIRSLMSLRSRGSGGVVKSGSSSSSSEGEAPPTRISVPLVTTPPTPTSVGSCSSLNSPVIRHTDNYDDGGLRLKKCGTVNAVADLFKTDSSLQIEPMKPINRLRVPPNAHGGSASRMCSRCSSLLSMASSSRYSINTTGSGFAPCGAPPPEGPPEPNMLCKLCLLEVPLSQSMEINQCGCVFCRDCMKLYVEFEIQEGAYDISCPDAQCHRQGIVTVNEVELLVTAQMMERYMRFRLNHEVDLDRNRTWCPRAGCETVCDICPREKCSPTSVHCPTCDSDFCSNCKNPWHRGLTCEENSRKLAREGHADFMEPGIPFDSDLIKCCPMCNVPIEKDEGCAQMMCKRCKHVFCWYCLASLDDDFLLRHYDKGPCKNKLGHSRASVIWHRTQVIGIFAGFGILLLVASPLLLVAAPCIVCCKCRVCSGTKLDADEDLPEDSGT